MTAKSVASMGPLQAKSPEVKVRNKYSQQILRSIVGDDRAHAVFQSMTMGNIAQVPGNFSVSLSGKYS